MNDRVAHSRHNPEFREKVIHAALPDLAGGMPVSIIAAKHGVSGRTLAHWLMNDDSAAEARAEFLTGRVMDAAEALDGATDQLLLARAREQFKAWSWLAERRLATLYGAKQEIHHTHDISDDLRAMSERKRLKQHTIDSANVLDVVPNDPTQS